jgi:hypothetical protein
VIRVVTALFLLPSVCQEPPTPYSYEGVRLVDGPKSKAVVRLITWPVVKLAKRIVSLSVWRTQMNEVMRFAPVTRENLQEAIEMLAKKMPTRIKPWEDVGEDIFPGPLGKYHVSWSYNPLAKELTLILIDKPRFVTVNKVKSTVRARLLERGILEVT